MPAKIYIGTSGYSYEDWVGPFYPPGTGKGDFLGIYSSRFSMVELNFTYYRQPDPRVLSNMAAATKEDFLFSVKAHRSMTHEREENPERAATTYIRGIEPLLAARRLAAVLLQFPYSFHYTRENRKYLGILCDTLKELPLAVEFRNSSWQRESVYTGLAARGIALTAVDCPPLEGLPEPVGLSTSSLGYIRFHGRNARNWWSGTNASRYDYLYSRDELDQWVDRVAEMAGNSSVLLIAFNNHWRGQAVRNAADLESLLLARSDLEIVRA